MRKSYKILFLLLCIFITIELSSCNKKSSSESSFLVSTESSEVSSSIIEESSAIVLKEIDMSAVSFPSKTFVYDGTEKILTIEGILPSHVSLVYTNNKLTNAGELNCSVSFIVDEGYKQVPTLTAKLTVIKKTLSSEDLNFKDKTVTYDGTSKSLTCLSRLPLGVNVIYTVRDFNTNLLAPLNLIDVGKYVVTAKFNVSNNYNEIPEQNAVLTIEKGTYDLTNITFPSKTFVYDSKEKSIFIEGDLPSGVTVTYSNNHKINAATYEVLAYFTGNKNYNTLEPMSSTITIEKKSVDSNNFIFSEDTFTYDSKNHYLKVLSYPATDMTYSSTTNYLRDPGTIQVTFTFNLVSYSEDELLYNYNYVEPITKILTVNKKTISLSNISLVSETFPFDGSSKSLKIKGDLPSEFSVSYINNERTEVGENTVTATFIPDMYTNSVDLTLMATLTVRKGTLADFYNKKDGFYFLDKTTIYGSDNLFIEVSGKLPEGLSAKYTLPTEFSEGKNIVTLDFLIDTLYLDSYETFPSVTAVLYLELESPSITYDSESHLLTFPLISGAISYIIYIDGEFLDEVTDNTYELYSYQSGSSVYVVAVYGEGELLSEPSNEVYIYFDTTEA